MSLIKQLWIGMIFLLLLVLGGSFVISIFSAQEYLQNQLKIKNIDDANALALSLSQMDKDNIDIELIISAQFDAGHYEYIMFNDQHKKPIVAKQADTHVAKVPDWFADNINLSAPPGIAFVQDEWQQYGSILVKSHSAYALETLWNEFKRLLEWFFISSLMATLAGIIIFRRLSLHLNKLIFQAEAISQRRFIESNESGASEFKRVTKAMNQLSNSVRSMLEKETLQLEALRRDSFLDPLTQLNNRQHFFNIFDNLINHEKSEDQGILILCRVANLQQLNNIYGYQHVDDILKDIAQAFYYFSQQHPNSHAGRLNGSDFAIAIPTKESLESIGAEFVQRLNFHLISQSHKEIATPLAITHYHYQDDRQSLMHQLDGALAQAEIKGDHAMIACLRDKRLSNHRTLQDWRTDLDNALQNNHLLLAHFPVIDKQGELLHFESPVRIKIDGQEKPAGYFIPWAARLNLSPVIDITVVKLAIDFLSRSTTPIAIHLSNDVLTNTRFTKELIDIISDAKGKAKSLWIEFSEMAMIRHPIEFSNLAQNLRPLGCKLGLEHLGLEFTQFDQLQDIGLDYIKIDSAIIRDINEFPYNQTFVQGLCKLGHELGILMVAEGVTTEAEKSTLGKIGVDAFTGPLIKLK